MHGLHGRLSTVDLLVLISLLKLPSLDKIGDELYYTQIQMKVSKVTTVITTNVAV